MSDPYPGAGVTTDSVFTIQDYLASRWTGGQTPAQIALGTSIAADLDSFGISGGPGLTLFNNFLAQYDANNPMPVTTDAFIQALVDFVDTVSGNNINTAANKATLKTTILDGVGKYLSLENSAYDQAAIAAALNDPALQANSSTFYEDVYEKAFNSYLEAVKDPGGTYTDFQDSLGDYFVKFATIVNPNGTAPNFQEIFQAFFGTNNADFTNFLANYIQTVMYPQTGTGVGFTANDNIGDWMKKVQEAYSVSIYGSGAPSTSSVGNSFKKLVIIDKVLALIIALIGTLQKVAAVQSDRLRILTLQQTAYTDLVSEVPVFTSGDGTIFGRPLQGPGSLTSKDEAQKARDEANSYNQTLTETARAKRTTIQDDAKVLQGNINQSTDSANEQASSGTALLQTLSTILGAIYR